MLITHHRNVIKKLWGKEKKTLSCWLVPRQTQTGPNDRNLLFAMQNRWPYERIGTSNGLPLTGLIKHYLDQNTLENITMDRVRGRPLIYGTHYCWLMTSTTLQRAQLLICLQAWTWRFWILFVVYFFCCCGYVWSEHSHAMQACQSDEHM